MNSTCVMTPRKEAVMRLSEERGRSVYRPLDPSLISKWCADLGFAAGLREFDAEQMEMLRAVNQHYADGGSRKQLLTKMRSPTWYQSPN